MTDVIFLDNEKKEINYLEHIFKNFDNLIKEPKPHLNINISKIKRNWKNIEKKFFVFVEKECGFKWKYKNYYVILSRNAKYSFASPFPEFEDKILIDLKCKKIILRIICHELLHQYLNQVIYDELKDEKFESSIIQELFVTHMLFDTKLNIFFDDGYNPKRNLLDANHKKAYEFYDKSKSIWNSKLNLEDYLKKILKVIRNEKPYKSK